MIGITTVTKSKSPLACFNFVIPTKPMDWRIQSIGLRRDLLFFALGGEVAKVSLSTTQRAESLLGSRYPRTQSL
jgi:hypothetical protein